MSAKFFVPDYGNLQTAIDDVRTQIAVVKAAIAGIVSRPQRPGTYFHNDPHDTDPAHQDSFNIWRATGYKPQGTHPDQPWDQLFWLPDTLRHLGQKQEENATENGHNSIADHYLAMVNGWVALWAEGNEAANESRAAAGEAVEELRRRAVALKELIETFKRWKKGWF